MEENREPVSLSDLCVSSSVFSPVILGVLESELPINDHEPIISLIEDIFLPINPRFSSVMVAGGNGVKNWKKVEVHFKNHVNVPNFPDEKPLEFYDKCLDEYLSKLAQEQLPPSRPLWEIHIFKYPTSNAAAAIIFKVHHSLGDGHSLVSLLLSCLKRADDPSRPLSFPSIQLRPASSQGGNFNGFFGRLAMMLPAVFNTVTDFGWSFMKSNFAADETSPIRSGLQGAEFLPVSITTVTFSLDEVKKIKGSFGLGAKLPGHGRMKSNDFSKCGRMAYCSRVESKVLVWQPSERASGISCKPP